MILEDYGYTPGQTPDTRTGTPARIKSVHRDRYAIISEYGETHGGLKTKE